MTLKEYLDRMEEKLEQSLGKELKEFIPRILKNIEKISLEKFINDGDPVLDLVEFKKIFDDTLSEGLNNRLTDKTDLIPGNWSFQRDCAYHFDILRCIAVR